MIDIIYKRGLYLYHNGLHVVVVVFQRFNTAGLGSNLFYNISLLFSHIVSVNGKDGDDSAISQTMAKKQQVIQWLRIYL